MELENEDEVDRDDGGGGGGGEEKEEEEHEDDDAGGRELSSETFAQRWEQLGEISQDEPFISDDHPPPLPPLLPSEDSLDSSDMVDMSSRPPEFQEEVEMDREYSISSRRTSFHMQRNANAEDESGSVEGMMREDVLSEFVDGEMSLAEVVGTEHHHGEHGRMHENDDLEIHREFQDQRRGADGREAFVSLIQSQGSTDPYGSNPSDPMMTQFALRGMILDGYDVPSWRVSGAQSVPPNLACGCRSRSRTGNGRLRDFSPDSGMDPMIPDEKSTGSTGSFTVEHPEGECDFLPEAVMHSPRIPRKGSLKQAKRHDSSSTLRQSYTEGIPVFVDESFMSPKGKRITLGTPFSHSTPHGLSHATTSTPVSASASTYPSASTSTGGKRVKRRRTSGGPSRSTSSSSAKTSPYSSPRKHIQRPQSETHFIATRFTSRSPIGGVPITSPSSSSTMPSWQQHQHAIMQPSGSDEFDTYGSCGGSGVTHVRGVDGIETPTKAIMGLSFHSPHLSSESSPHSPSPSYPHLSQRVDELPGSGNEEEKWLKMEDMRVDETHRGHPVESEYIPSGETMDSERSLDEIEEIGRHQPHAQQPGSIHGYGTSAMEEEFFLQTRVGKETDEEIEESQTQKRRMSFQRSPLSSSSSLSLSSTPIGTPVSAISSRHSYGHMQPHSHHLGHACPKPNPEFQMYPVGHVAGSTHGGGGGGSSCDGPRSVTTGTIDGDDDGGVGTGIDVGVGGDGDGDGFVDGDEFRSSSVPLHYEPRFTHFVVQLISGERSNIDYDPECIYKNRKCRVKISVTVTHCLPIKSAMIGWALREIIIDKKRPLRREDILREQPDRSDYNVIQTFQQYKAKPMIPGQKTVQFSASVPLNDALIPYRKLGGLRYVVWGRIEIFDASSVHPLAKPSIAFDIRSKPPSKRKTTSKKDQRTPSVLDHFTPSPPKS
eukprot:TRINITY_DN4918_c0_g1_i1.p1 TRINITY_DN4918_c0_g1~~TRINITY_DN4918_c0_g1_i1.p1  ORF type:complete len:938 (-),score=265.00 TRINITY_DN4918_c0_g1_i1:97-2910(-)